MPAHAIYLQHIRGVKLLNLQANLLHPAERPASLLIDAPDMNAADFLKLFPVETHH